MADITNLEQFLTDVATSIKNKKGTTEPIPAANFDIEIESIATGTVVEKVVAEANQIVEDETVVKIDSTPIPEPVVIPENGVAEVLTDKALLAENIGLTADKILEGNTILDIVGTGKGGTGTSDATATEDDILSPKTAYAGNKKITGAIQTDSNDIYCMEEKRYSIGNYCDITCNGLLLLVKQDTVVTVYRTDTNESVGSFNVYTTSSVRFSYEGETCSNGKLYNIYYDRVRNTPDINELCVRRVFVSNNIKNIYVLTEDYDGYSYYLNIDQPVGWEGIGGTIYPHRKYPNVVCRTSSSRQTCPSIKLYNVYKSSVEIVGAFSGEVATGYYDTSRGHWANDDIFCIQYNGSNVFRIFTCVFDSGYIQSISVSTRTLTEHLTYSDGTYILSGKTLYDFEGNMITEINSLPSYNNILMETEGQRIIYSIELNSVIQEYLLDESYSIKRLHMYDNTIGSLYNGSGVSCILEPYKIRTKNDVSDVRFLVNEYNKSNIINKLIRKQDTLYNTIDSDISAEYIISGKIAYGENGRVIGSMPDNTNIEFNSSIEDQIIPEGYYNGNIIKRVTSDIDINIVPGNIRKGATILEVEGSFEGSTGGDATSDGNLQAKYLLEGYSAVVDGKWIEGTMKEYGDKTIIPTSEDIDIPEGHYNLLSIPIINAANCKDYSNCNEAILSI